MAGRAPIRHQGITPVDPDEVDRNGEVVEAEGPLSSVDSLFDDKTFIPKRLADVIMRRFPFIYAHEDLWVYRDGCYRRGGEALVEAECQRVLGEAFRLNRATETLGYIRIHTRCDPPDPTGQYINLVNGRLNWMTGELEAHDPEMLDLYQLPVRYDPKATCPRFDAYLDSTLDADVHPMVEEVLGLVTIPYTGFEKALMLTGEGANGKGVFLDTIEALLGSDNVSNVALQDLEENRFRVAELDGPLANIFADLDSRAMHSSSLFKTLVTGDRVTAERKFGQPFTFRSHARMLYSANKLPPSNDRTHAFYRRWIILPFTRTFEGTKDDKTLRSRLTTPDEISGIFNRALWGLKRLFTREQFTEPESVRQALAQYKIENDTVAAFVSECCREWEDGFISKDDFYHTYALWCEDQGLPMRQKVPKNKIKLPLLRAMPGAKEGRSSNIGPRGWNGITFTEGAPQ